VLRTATLGELASSLAHELNQPLTSVLSNAQAALRYLNADNPDLDELRAIIKDIVSDDKRAGEIIRRLRGLMQRGDMEFKPLSINELIRDVLPLIHSDAVIRQISLESKFAVGLPQVLGDSIQIQQVILNLVRNASDALQNLDAERRRVIISTIRENADFVRVAVKDMGKGFDAADAEKLFQQFYTSKSDGLGMGLAISRSICEAHGGRIWAVPNHHQGATFYLSLPVLHGGGSHDR
jgi:two-component system sensor kinase FixL